ncbi:hypothetical protein GGR52DRAFT_552245 [Hypoxylon sp. FL1284]|nr:hypothetical protein GGR52DRAFT_552245 [Hypoxylon sp. FL1284]
MSHRTTILLIFPLLPLLQRKRKKKRKKRIGNKSPAALLMLSNVIDSNSCRPAWVTETDAPIRINHSYSSLGLFSTNPECSAVFLSANPVLIGTSSGSSATLPPRLPHT